MTVLISLSLVVPVAPEEELDDFDVEVRASEESVRAGQPFNVTCVAPTGLGFQQQWLHPKKQARCSTFFFSVFKKHQTLGLSCLVLEISAV